MEELKVCRKCKEAKSVEMFSPLNSGRSKRYAYCRPCAREYQRSNSSTFAKEEKVRKEHAEKLSKGLRTCTDCKETKEVSYFYKDSRHLDGLQSHCKNCFNRRQNEGRLLREYGIDSEEYRRMLNHQKGLCAICKCAPKYNKFNVDHCHRTHVIRSLLCVNCNTNLLPYVEHRPELIERALEYLKEPPALEVIGIRKVPASNQSRRRKKRKPKYLEDHQETA